MFSNHYELMPCVGKKRAGGQCRGQRKWECAEWEMSTEWAISVARRGFMARRVGDKLEALLDGMHGGKHCRTQKKEQRAEIQAQATQ